MSKIKMMALSGLVIGSALFGGGLGCIGGRLFNFFDFGVAAALTALLTPP